MGKGTRKEGAYWYYIVERAYPARISTDPNEFGGAVLHRDGTWHRYNTLKIEEDGCMVSEPDALTFWGHVTLPVTQSSGCVASSSATYARRPTMRTCTWPASTLVPRQVGARRPEVIYAGGQADEQPGVEHDRRSDRGA